GKLDLREELVRELPFDMTEDPGKLAAELLSAGRKIAGHGPHWPIRAARQVRGAPETCAVFPLRPPLGRSDPKLRCEMAEDLLDLERGERVFQLLRIGQGLDQLLPCVCQSTEHPLPYPSLSCGQPCQTRGVIFDPRAGRKLRQGRMSAYGHPSR